MSSQKGEFIIVVCTTITYVPYMVLLRTRRNYFAGNFNECVITNSDSEQLSRSMTKVSVL